MSELRRYGLRQLEWDKNEGDTPFASANAVIDRHNREVLKAFNAGFAAALEGAFMCVDSWKSYDLLNHGKTAQGIRESLQRMTPERHVDYMAKIRGQ